MSSYLYNKEIEYAYDVDVLVVGGGPGGFGAAIGAARGGAEVLLIEKQNYLGGLMTGGLVNTFEYNDERIFHGLYTELVHSLRERNAILNDSWISRTYEPEQMKRLLDEMCKAHGVKVLLKTTFVDAIVENSVIKGALISSIEGLQAVRAKVVIDCTCVASVAKRAGAELYDIPDHIRENYLTRFTVRNVDLARVMNLVAEDDDYYSDTRLAILYPRDMGYDGLIPHCPVICGGQKDLQAAMARGEYTFDRWPTVLHGNITCDGKIEFLIWVCNKDGVIENEKGRFVAAYCDALHAFDAQVLTSVEMSLREQANAMTDYLRKNVRGFENAVLDITSNGTGLLVNHIKGAHAANEQEMLEGAVYDDSVMVAYGYVDSVVGRRCDTLPHDVPYGVLYSVNIDNLMAGGYNVSAVGHGQQALMMQPNCLMSGQAAGTAAAQAAKKGISVRKVDVSALQASLRSQGVLTSCKELAPDVMEDYLEGVADVRRRRANGEKDQKRRNV